jgi:hypothetical protein
VAERDLQRYRRGGPDAVTRLMLAELRVGHCKEKISWISAAGLGSLVLNSLAPG